MQSIKIKLPRLSYTNSKTKVKISLVRPMQSMAALDPRFAVLSIFEITQSSVTEALNSLWGCILVTGA